MTVVEVVKKPRKPRRTKEQMAADRGKDLARAVSDLPLGQLVLFFDALSQEVAEYLRSKMSGDGS